MHLIRLYPWSRLTFSGTDTDNIYRYRVPIPCTDIDQRNPAVTDITTNRPEGDFNDTDIELIHTNIDYPFQHQYATNTDREREKKRERDRETKRPRLRD